MKIDLHCHTKAIRRGELATRNVTKELFVEKVNAANVKIVAITNHDVFDRAQFEEFQTEAGVSCTLWPGVELNVIQAGEKYHLIIIASPAKIDEFDVAVQSLTAGKPGNFDVRLEDVVAVFEGMNVLYLPHYGNKTPAISRTNLEDFYEMVSGNGRVILEDSNSRSTAILSSHGMRVITGSDIKDWSIYQSIDVSELRIPVDTYEHFCLFLDRDPVVIRTLLEKNYSKKYAGKPSKENEAISIDIPLFNEVNIIFGDKGTGKSQILDSIRKKMEADGLSVSTYVSSKKDEDIKDLIDPSDMDRDASKVGLDECEDEFDFIKSWGDKSIEMLKTFVRHGETKHMAANKERIKFIEPQVMPYDENIINGVESDLESAKLAVDNVEDIEGEYLPDEDTNLLKDGLRNLVKQIEASRKKEIIEKYSCRLMEYTTRQVRRVIAAKTGTVAKPASVGFYDYAKNRLALINSSDKILRNIVPKSHKDHALLGNIGDKGDLFIESRWKMLDENPGGKEYVGSPNITSLRESLGHIKNIKKYALSDDPQNYLDEFQKSYEEKGINRVGVFVGTSKYIVDANFNEYDPSNGEKAIVIIQRSLELDTDVYLLDEPELSLGGTYIDKVIRPQITKLGNSGKVVFIATHNANIAVRTLPYNTIFRHHDKEGYKTYLGNPFTNSLVNIEDSSDILDWKETSMRVLEGGEDAFSDRGDIYESGRTKA